MSIFVRLLCAVLLTLAVSTVAATGQAEAPGSSEKPATSTEPSPPAELPAAAPAADPVKQPPGDPAARLPQVVVSPGARPPSPQPQSRPSTIVSAAPSARQTTTSRRSRGTRGGTASNQAGPTQSEGSLTVPTADQARKEIEQQTPGSVAVVPDTQYKNTPAQTVKDIVDYVAGVWAQPKWGDDTRLSIRGSGLSRNFHLRGIQLYMDGIPINTSDVTEISRRSIPQPTGTSRSTRGPTRCGSAQTRSEVPSISSCPVGVMPVCWKGESMRAHSDTGAARQARVARTSSQIISSLGPHHGQTATAITAPARPSI